MASIKKRDNGKWRARYRDEAGVEHARHFTTKAEGQRWLDEVTASIVTGAYVDPRAGRITFEAYFKAWLEDQVYEDTTRRAVVLAAGTTTFGGLPLKTIRRRHIEGWVKDMNAVRKLEAGTIHTRMNFVRKVFKSAVADRVISQDPCTGVALPGRVRRAAAMRVPSTQDVGRLLAAAEDDFTTFIAVCAFAGLRLGEAAALQLGDVNFPRRLLTVRRQVQRLGGGEVELRLPKYRSVRDVPLSDGLVAMLSEHAGRRGLGAGRDESSFIFANAAGQPPHQNTIGHQWRRTLKAAGLHGIKLHDLRHFYASGLIHDGCDVVTVQNALGHAKPTTTLNTYAHLWPTADDRTRNSSAKLLQQALSEADSAANVSAPRP